MKNRSGFVSNSSSSSFVVVKTDVQLFQNELIEKTMSEYIAYHGKWVSEDGEDGEDEYYLKKAKEYAEKDQHVFYIARVEYGAEGDIEKIVKDLLHKFDIDQDNITIEWDE